MGRHGHRQVGQGLEGREVAGERREIGRDGRQFDVAVDLGPAVAGAMFHDRQGSPGHQPFGEGAPQTRDAFGVATEGPIPDDAAAALLGDVEHRRAIDRDAAIREVAGHQLPAAAGQPDAGRRVDA